MYKENISTKTMRIALDVYKQAKPLMEKNHLNDSLLAVFLEISLYAPINMSELAINLCCDNAKITRDSQKLITLGYVEKSRPLRDQRVCVVNLTPEGKEIAEEFYRFFDSYDAQISGILTKDELASVSSVQDKIITGLKVNNLFRFD
ncbi:MAG: hypothetical protein LKJ88_01670 [Bacilli bacterium]|jgi:DNA-binding MarR family transcriptional regulator|nr:hypothetical protein [Bacilli bacterium]